MIYLYIQYLREKYLVKNKIKNIVVSDKFNTERFHTIYGLRPTIINYGIDYDFFSGRGEGEQQEDDSFANKFVILHVGMITPFKNQMESLKALNATKNKIPESVLVFAGGGYDENYKKLIDAYIQDNNILDRVIFKGHINRSQLRSLYHRSNVMIHPIKAQGGWLSPFEMMRAGKPVIVSKEFTASYLVEKNRLAIITDNYDEAILDIYLHHGRIAGMVERGREY